MRKVSLRDFFIGSNAPLTIISGPCVIENEEHTLKCADYLVALTSKLHCNFIFKASYDKANRTSIHSFRGPGIEEGLKILEKVKNTFNVPVFTDVHSSTEALEAADVCDVIQVPAFLSRQTDLVVAAGKSGAIVNVKKGQFMAPWDMQHVVEKIESTGNKKILLTDRGTSFGYNNLVSDFRAIPIMQSFGYPVFFDATHSVQLPGGLGQSSGGERKFAAALAKAALAVGCDGIYAETHPDPAHAKSDPSTVLPFSTLPRLIEEWIRLYEVVQTQCLETTG